jgi:tRNA1Val (adenine37-N6)-methyltransferase
MKVGTDAVLLGSWVNVRSVNRALDIGTGSGIIALMLAQRSNAIIDAIDVDALSVKQAVENAKRSKWKERIRVNEDSLQNYYKINTYYYDLIVTNPPYFIDSLKSPVKNRNLARHNDNLGYDELLAGVKKLLSNDGLFGLILPFEESVIFQEKAITNGLFPIRMLEVFPKESKATNRILAEYSFQRPMKIVRKKLLIRNEDNSYTDEYKELTKEFYMEF